MAIIGKKRRRNHWNKRRRTRKERNVRKLRAFAKWSRLFRLKNMPKVFSTYAERLRFLRFARYARIRYFWRGRRARLARWLKKEYRMRTLGLVVADSMRARSRLNRFGVYTRVFAKHAAFSLSRALKTFRIRPRFSLSVRAETGMVLRLNRFLDDVARFAVRRSLPLWFDGGYVLRERRRLRYRLSAAAWPLYRFNARRLKVSGALLPYRYSRTTGFFAVTPRLALSRVSEFGRSGPRFLHGIPRWFGGFRRRVGFLRHPARWPISRHGQNRQALFRYNRSYYNTFVLRMRRVKYPVFLFRRSLLKRFRHPLRLTFIRKNFFFLTPVNRLGSIELISTGLMNDFANSTKKKKTYVAGRTAIRYLVPFLRDFRVMGISVSVRGRLPARKGAVKTLRTFLKPAGIRLTSFRSLSRVMHNGTKSYSKRRL